MGRRSARMTGLLLALLASACAPDAPRGDRTPSAAPKEAENATHAVSGLKLVPVVVNSGETRHRFRAELADRKELQAKGLMHRTELGPDEAMLFPSEQPTARSFWMKNTPISLDIIFIGLDGRISNIAAMAEPYSEEQVYSVGSASAVLEIAGGRAAELGIAPGDRVIW